MAPSSCEKCETCRDFYYRENCGVGSPGRCVACTRCKAGEVQIKQCDEVGDTICSNNTDCTKFGVHCEQGSYHAGCDPSIGEMGWCEECPIQEPSQCPTGFFLNFKCTNGKPISNNIPTRRQSLVPNECLPCNRFRCNEIGENFPLVEDCGNPNILTTMYAPTIECNGECTKPTARQWIERPCQYYISKEDQDYRIRR